MIKEKITIINKLGLHARAASKLVSCANQFESEVFITRKGNRVNAKSIMGVMMLAASQGVELEFDISGNDEQECLEAIIDLVNDRFSENE